ncbi:hypothetical protein GZ77_00085 [Endozoicomonas montiporae]|uniref:Esterase n=2 Tax=Endozoicomonas montiporae TaxID=1027273 RepID=A0A081N9L9_9GAMM|nr:YqiA/YcfP family alpha/beta fold hydrolase [Endozoicomonas montiporae]AMO54994.1 esterase YqiA [Endozoicomonas montiporae CL-33]KEQ15142.1 hypothetical protein GZ77_00085 [Endozoicomonas montiporae]
MTKTPLLIYLHGLNSSSRSTKAQQTIHYVHKNKLDIDLWVPDLPCHPEQARRLMSDRIRREYGMRPVYIIGSSLGGYYGTWLMQRLIYLHPDIVTRLVLINPAVRPYELFRQYLGKQTNFHTGEEWELTTEHVATLESLETFWLDNARDILLMVQEGDETLDYRKAQEKYARSHIITQKGGSHAFEHYDDMLPTIFDFLSEKPVL